MSVKTYRPRMPRRTALVAATIATAALVGCGGSGDSSAQAPLAPAGGYSPGSVPTDPTATIRDQKAWSEALSNSSREAHEARMEGYSSIAP